MSFLRGSSPSSWVALLFQFKLSTSFWIGGVHRIVLGLISIDSRRKQIQFFARGSSGLSAHQLRNPLDGGIVIGFGANQGNTHGASF
jgi:hypothetical protein